MQSSDLNEKALFERKTKARDKFGNPVFESAFEVWANIEEQSGAENYVSGQTKRQALSKAVFTVRKTPVSMQAEPTMRIFARGFHWEIVSLPRQSGREYLKIDAERTK